MLFKRIITLLLIGAVLVCCNNKQIPVKAAVNNISKATSDTTKKSDPKAYKDIIPANAIVDKGLFTIDRVDDRYFFEIPDSLLEKDILIVNRIAKAAADVRPDKYTWGYAGDQIGERVIRFSKAPGNKLLIKAVSFTERSVDSSENGMYHTVVNSNLLPIIASFDIKAFTNDSLASIIDVTNFLLTENGLFYFSPRMKSRFELGALQKDKSFILNLQSFPINVELRSVISYALNNESVTYELNSSFVLLPREPMKPRYRDERVGYFFTFYYDYDRPQKVDLTTMILKWRLEPKEEDKEKYLRGELVEPKKPIVYYIDPATPKKWIPYLIQGVDDWQKAFEKAGFKNAIYALEAPVNDPEWNLYDARHNAIIYKASPLPNASGPQVHDPRTGEILETHINWYHNVMQLIHDWYMVQAGPNDLAAREMLFNDSLMGQLIRFVSSHEVGHTLGLLHNFGASSTIPVDSLRNRKYVEKNGFCPSIMDYARFNYVAQPEDSISEKGIFPRIGVYDEWAINWGYRWLPQLKTREEELAYMNHWIIGETKKDKRLFYGAQQLLFIVDPRNQFEDLGDDAMKAGYYGIKNLKRVYSNLLQWTKEPNEGFENLKRIQKAVLRQYELYLFHVTNNIALTMTSPKTVEENGPVVSFTPKQKQKQAVQFLHEQLFETPHWLLNKDIFLRISQQPNMTILSLQRRALELLISFNKYSKLLYFQTAYPNDAYVFEDYITDIESGIWKELKTRKNIDMYRRNVQKMYVEVLAKEISTLPVVSILEVDMRKFDTDYSTIIQSHMRKLLKEIKTALQAYKDELSRRHLISLQVRLNQALVQARKNDNDQSKGNSNESAYNRELTPSLLKEYNNTGTVNCWDSFDPFFNRVRRFPAWPGTLP
jgi:hypothetical protein